MGKKEELQLRIHSFVRTLMHKFARPVQLIRSSENYAKMAEKRDEVRLPIGSCLLGAVYPFALQSKNGTFLEFSMSLW